MVTLSFAPKAVPTFASLDEWSQIFPISRIFAGIILRRTARVVLFTRYSYQYIKRLQIEKTGLTRLASRIERKRVVIRHNIWHMVGFIKRSVFEVQFQFMVWWFMSLLVSCKISFILTMNVKQIFVPSWGVWFLMLFATSLLSCKLKQRLWRYVDKVLWIDSMSDITFSVCHKGPNFE